MNIDENEFPLGDMLTEATRKERRNLLLSSCIGLAATKLDIVPTELSTLGLKFSSTDPTHILLLLAGVIGYFLVAFIICVLSDWNRHPMERALREWLRRRELALGTPGSTGGPRQPVTPTKPASDKSGVAELMKITRFANAKLAFEVCIPLVIGLYALVLLAIGAAHSS